MFFPILPHRDMVPLNNGQFPNFVTDVDILINSGRRLVLNLFTNVEGTVYAIDTSGNNIDKRLIIRMEYDFPHNDENTNEPVDGYFIITFDDNTSFAIYDANHMNYWYSFEDLDPLVIKQFT
jgi:hypothetical protein